MKFDHRKIEVKWQRVWEKTGIYRADDKSKKPKKYVLIEFPYPSGEGLHMGHLRPYVAGDVYARYSRLQGFETMYPIGWDAFGLPAENFAIKKGIHPSITTTQNIKNAKKQVQSWGMSFDWSREINTTDPAYYKWTQWIFLQFYKAGLAYEATGLINWCPKDKTGLANEEVIDGACERCGSIVEKKEMRQWYLKITSYAEKLLEGLKTLAWPEQVKVQQENWIGRSEGAEIEFPLSVVPASEPESRTGSRVKPGMTNYVLLHGFNGNPKTGVFFPWLIKNLENQGFKVQAPQLPNASLPTEEEQVGHVLKSVKFDRNTILFGHSLGAVVAMKVAEKLKTKIAGLVLAGGFIEHNFKDRPRLFDKTFDWHFDFENIKSKAGFVKILSSIDDYAVPIEQGRILQQRLSGELIETKGIAPHFTGKQEPMILENLVKATPLPTSPHAWGEGQEIKVFTTRPDTIFGATYMVLAPEHLLVQNLESRIENKGEVKKYINEAKKKTDIQRSALDKEKTGVELKGIKAINPATKEEIPVLIADYVLMGYGTGAIMAVPGHDERDFEFAKKYGLPIREVIRPLPASGHPPQAWGGVGGEVESAFVGEGELINSGPYNGFASEEARRKITADFGELKVQYKLRDWVFSRQRYWGEPIPIIHCPKCGVVPVPEKDLPVMLPDVKKYEPTGTGESPLAAIKSWVNVKCPKCKGQARRETNTMPQWAGSSWYYLRYADPHSKQEIAAKKLLRRWLPVDIYFGGMEHTTLHLLYSRFWHLFLHDQKLVSTAEPYARRVPHGTVLGPDGEKMSKSRGNVVNPDEIVKMYGADTLRMYEMFLGPHEAAVAWNNQGIIGVRRFLERVWKLGENVKLDKSEDRDMARQIHKAVKKVTEDIENFRFNTAISTMMILANYMASHQSLLAREQFAVFLRILAPFAPHIAEELWKKLGGQESVHLAKWPKYDKRLIKDALVEIAVQVNGRVRATVRLSPDASKDDAHYAAVKDPHVEKYVAGKDIAKFIYIPGKIINIVMK